MSLFIGMPDTKDYVFDGHTGTGPSQAERWMHCTASLAAARAFLETLTLNQQTEFAKSSMAARQGTTAHTVAEAEALFMLGKITEDDLQHTLMEMTVMPEHEGEAYNEEMAEFIIEYVDLLKQFHDAGREVLVEHRISAVIPLMTVDADGDQETYTITGSGDAAALPSEDEMVLDVVDLKYGDNIWVDPDENPQCRIYALGFLAELVDDGGNLPDGLDTINYHIVQPRLGGIKTWSESVEDLLAWRDDVLSPALTEALGGSKAGAAFNPSEQACQWCPARGTCAALAESRVEAAAELFDTIVEAEFADGPGAFPETGSLSDERLGGLLAQVMGLTKIQEALKEEAQRRLHRGTKVKGFKLVSYTPHRRWTEEAAEELKHTKVPGIWKEPELVSPTQAIKAMATTLDKPTIKAREEEAAKQLAELIVAPDKRPIVAPEGDRRKEWGGKPPEEMFDIEEEA